MKLKTLATMALVGAALLTSTAAIAEHTQSDLATTLSVKLALLNKLGVDSLHVDVDANGGAVLLSGTVNKRETRELAETVAESVAGVTTVNNELKLASNEANPNKAGVVANEAESEVKDAVLETKIRLALVNKMGTDGFKVGTEAASGTVTLEFDKDFTAARRQEATMIVKGVEGVSKVNSVDKK